MKKYTIYILECVDKTYYTGQTTNIAIEDLVKNIVQNQLRVK